MLPTATQFVALVNPNSFTGEAQKADLQAAAQNLGIELHVVSASSESDFDGAFAAVAKFRPTGLVINGDAYFNDRSTQLATGGVSLCGACHLPVSGIRRSWWTYELWHQSRGCVPRRRVSTQGVFSKAIAWPITGPAVSEVKFVINLQTAKAFGLTVPDKVLAIADEAIE